MLGKKASPDEQVDSDKAEINEGLQQSSKYNIYNTTQAMKTMRYFEEPVPDPGEPWYI